jgi:RNA recognition motif-containing protein
MENTNRSKSPDLFGSSMSGSSQGRTEDPLSGSGSDTSSLLDLWSSLHPNQHISGEDEMLIVRNTFLELCKLAGSSIHTPDRFVSAPAIFSFPSDESTMRSGKSSTTTDVSPTSPPSYSVVEKTTASDEEAAPVTTVMMRNIPTRISSSKLIETVLSYKSSVTDLIDFLYLPIDFKTNKNLGYCFINFKTPNLRKEFMKKFNNQKYLFCDTSEKLLQISPSNRQGYFENLLVFTQTKLLDTWPRQYRPLAEFNGELVPIDSQWLTSILQQNVPEVAM